MIIVDDGSENDIKKFLEGTSIQELNYRFFKIEHNGVSAARNYGILQAKGQFITFLDADDILLPEKISRQVHFLEHNHQYGAVCSDVIHIDGNGKYQKRSQSDRYPLIKSNTDIYTRLIIQDFLIVSSVMMRRELVEHLPCFDTTLHVFEDWDYFLEAAKITEFGYIDETLVRYRVHEDGAHNQPAIALRDGLKVIKKNKEYIEKKKLNINVDNTYFLFYRNVGYSFLLRKDLIHCRECFQKSWKWKKDITALFLIIMTFFPQKMVHFIVNFRQRFFD